jgi:hypothetical protein
METRDYNGTDFWSVESVSKRYESYAQRFDVPPPSVIEPHVYTETGTRWIYPIMDKIIDCIEKKDLACIEIGIEFIEESGSFPFGMTLKYNTARALRRASDSMSDEQKERIRKRVAEMLCTGYLPREFRQYAKLVRKIGLATWQRKIEREANLEDKWVNHYYKIIINNVGD